MFKFIRCLVSWKRTVVIATGNKTHTDLNSSAVQWISEELEALWPYFCTSCYSHFSYYKIVFALLFWTEDKPNKTGPPQGRAAVHQTGYKKPLFCQLYFLSSFQYKLIFTSLWILVLKLTHTPSRSSFCYLHPTAKAIINSVQTCSTGRNVEVVTGRILENKHGQ